MTTTQAALALLSLLALACAEANSPLAPYSARVEASFVSGAAAAALGADGLLRIPTPPPGPYSQIDANRAVVLAQAYLTTFGQLANYTWKSDRQGVIDAGRLHTCARVVLAQSAYEPLPATVSVFTRKQFGAFWLVPACDIGTTPVVIIAVSIHDTDVTINASGYLSQPPPSGANFLSMGIPVGVELPTTPEAAVKLTAQTTGRRVDKIPQFVREGGYKAPWLGVWTMGLDAPLNVLDAETDGVESLTDAFAGFFDSWTLALLRKADPSGDPQTETLRDNYIDGDGNGRPDFAATYRDVASPRFERIVLQRH